MIDYILGQLEIAEQYEIEAQRLRQAENNSPNWVTTYAQCLKDASCERAIARKLAAYHQHEFNRSGSDHRDKRREPGVLAHDIREVTVGQILRWAAIARSSSVGTRKLKRAAERMSQVAAALDSGNALEQILWWTGEVVPEPPGRVREGSITPVPLESTAKELSAVHSA
ncbi:MAG: hypothetical protein WAL75_04305 [Terracidiphilus sp.]